MDNSFEQVLRLNLIRNQYAPAFLNEKSALLETLGTKIIKGKKALTLYYETLLFLIAYPDNKTISQKATNCLHTLELYIKNNTRVAESLYNTGVAGTQVCAAFSFEIVKWLRQRYKRGVEIYSIDAGDGEIMSILSVVMPKVESEILQDANDGWKEWLHKTGLIGEDLLDKLIRIFDQTDIRPEVKDELWTALQINVILRPETETRLPAPLTYPFYHRALVKSKGSTAGLAKPVKVKLTTTEAAQIIDCARMILIQHLREIDPITFAAPQFVSYYKLQRGITVALFATVPERRHPIDNYMGYAAFKNGLPIAYAGSWVLFDSARIGLNVFPAYRGGESRLSFEEILDLHRQVYRLKRFTVDPYQIGRHNDDGIQSGAFWLYHRLGFRPIKPLQKQMAEHEYIKIKAQPGYRTPAKTLKVLAGSRMELVLNQGAVNFDAVDVSIAYANIMKNHYANNRKVAEEKALNKLVKFTGIKNPYHPNLNFVIKNWAVILDSVGPELYKNKALRQTLKKAFQLKATGREEEFMAFINQSTQLRNLIKKAVAANVA